MMQRVLLLAATFVLGTVTTPVVERVLGDEVAAQARVPGLISDASVTPPPRVIEDAGSPFNTAVGFEALAVNTSGTYNAAAGYRTLRSNTSGSWNTAGGSLALMANTSGIFNTAVGHSALINITTEADNVAVGHNAGFNARGSNNIYLGANVLGGIESNTLRVGVPYNAATGKGQLRTFMAGIHGTQLAGPAVQVFIDASGQLGTLTAPIASGSISAPVASAARPPETDPAVVAELRERVARLEALVEALARRR